MKDRLIKLLDNAYAPYSNFKVASVVKMRDGNTFDGVNVENASYGATICAERVAITSAIASGYKPLDFDSIYVMSSSGNFDSCCFLCRQVIMEFFPKDGNIILVDKNGNEKVFKVLDLCPYPFDSNNLKS